MSTGLLSFVLWLAGLAGIERETRSEAALELASWAATQTNRESDEEYISGLTHFVKAGVWILLTAWYLIGATVFAGEATAGASGVSLYILSGFVYIASRVLGVTRTRWEAARSRHPDSPAVTSTRDYADSLTVWIRVLRYGSLALLIGVYVAARM